MPKRKKNPAPKIIDSRFPAPENDKERLSWFRHRESWGWEHDSYTIQQPLILYHATTAVSHILQDGFKAREFSGRTGLGGGTSYAVSFTQDLELACEIARCLKEAILVCNNSITVDDIVKTAKKQGVLDTTLKYWLGSYWSVKELNPLDAIEHLKKGYKVNYNRYVYAEDELLEIERLHPLAKGWMGGDNRMRYAFPTLIEATEEELREMRFDLYRKYLAAADAAKVRVDPLFFLPKPHLYCELDIDDVGVIEAELLNPVFVPRRNELKIEWEMREGKPPIKGAFTYLDSMDEYRVFDASGLAIKRVIDCEGKTIKKNPTQTSGRTRSCIVCGKTIQASNKYCSDHLWHSSS